MSSASSQLAFISSNAGNMTKQACPAIEAEHVVKITSTPLEEDEILRPQMASVSGWLPKEDDVLGPALDRTIVDTPRGGTRTADTRYEYASVAQVMHAPTRGRTRARARRRPPRCFREGKKIPRGGRAEAAFEGWHRRWVALSCIWDASAISSDARYLSHLDVLSPGRCARVG
ncbi:hypothetical protein HYPSUDRAFT_209364 [Hypholoma sublateritium FD-334 SS-4]|uniref:Uncharacterized protein n=1 Tax=Hypholoma sublateritium (strain FD-334 SS-4) TaxID=945553 RepID=A0A0D2N361_HYPSF|nr:hypothetical protein HYPSUDRAFT_209364 [Hypholoma sublateritium FD-334 SS-4]